MTLKKCLGRPQRDTIHRRSFGRGFLAFLLDPYALSHRDDLNTAIVERHRYLSASGERFNTHQHHIHRGFNHQTWQHTLAIGGSGN